MYFLIFSCSPPGLKQVGIFSFYHFYVIRISPLIFRPEIMNLSNSFLNVLNIFADFFYSSAGLKQVGLTSFYHFYRIWISPLDYEPFYCFSNCLKSIGRFFSFVSGLETSLYILIEIQISTLPPPQIRIISDSFSNGLKSPCRFIPYAYRLEKKSADPYLITLWDSNFTPGLVGDIHEGGTGSSAGWGGALWWTHRLGGGAQHSIRIRIVFVYFQTNPK